jgi:hypothetical protein
MVAEESPGQRARDLAARRVLRVQHAADRMRPFTRQVERAVAGAVERGATA